MKIGIVTTWFERGAAYVSRTYMELLSSEHNVFIYARGGEKYAVGDLKWDRPNVTWGKRTKAGYPSSVEWEDFRNWVESCKLHIIIFNEEHSWDVILRSRKLNVLIGAYIDYYTKETVPYFDLYDFLLCNTQRHFSVFKSHLQAFYIPWGTDTQTFRPRGNWPETRPPTTFFHSAGMGGVNLRKGTDLLVKAFQQVTGDVRLVIHSQVPSERYGEAGEMIERDNRIEFIQSDVDPPDLYHYGDVYVYPSRLEGIGLTIAEALASGLPVITTNNAPMNEFVQHNQTGRLVKVDQYRTREDGYYWPESICSISHLAATMQFYVNHVDEVARQKRLARDYALRYLDWTKNAAELPDVVAQLKKIPVDKKLANHVRQQVNHLFGEYYIGEAFRAHSAGERVPTIRNVAIACRLNEEYLYNPGAWSIGAQAVFGARVADLLKRAKRRL